MIDEPIQERLGKKIPLVETFGPTIQGEGTVIGQQTYFLRFGLCDYRCAMCDSLHAVLPQEVKKNAQWLTQEEIFDQFQAYRRSKEYSTNWVTFSGGNPAMHDLKALVTAMHGQGLKINVETQGTIYKDWLSRVDSLTISPKGPGMMEPKGHTQKVFESFITSLEDGGQWGYYLDNGELQLPNICIKIVVFDQRDLEFARDIFTYLKGCPLFSGKDTSNHFYLSLGNTTPPNPDGSPLLDPDYPMEEGIALTTAKMHQTMLQNYRMLSEDIMQDSILSLVRFLPQWHTFVWGNSQGH